MRLLAVVVVLVVVASIAGWWVALYSPARDQQLALEQERSTLLSRESQLANQRQQLLALQDNAPEIRRSLDRLSQFIPPDPDQDSFLELLQLAGNASGVTFTALTFTDPAPVEGAPPTADLGLVLGAITVTGSTESSYFQLIDFLRRLEVEVPRAVLVEQVDVREGTGGFPAVATTFVAQMFALVPAPVVPVDPNAPVDPAASPTPPPGESTESPTPVPGTTPVPTEGAGDAAPSSLAVPAATDGARLSSRPMTTGAGG